MISYVTFGASDIARAKRFYGAILHPLGYGVRTGADGLSYSRPAAPGHPAPPDFYVKPPFDGAPATAGNGTMVAFEAHSPTQVRALHTAGCAAGGADDGPPGFRAAYSADFYVAYLRDPDGNKIALFAIDPAPAPGVS